MRFYALTLHAKQVQQDYFVEVPEVADIETSILAGWGVLANLQTANCCLGG